MKSAFWKRFITLFSIITLIVNFIFVNSNMYSFACDYQSSLNSNIRVKRTVTVIGDSIAYGHGINEEDTFGNLVSKAISMKLKPNEVVELNNFAISGDNTTDLLDIVTLNKNLIECIKRSDFVLINIGSNNLLKPAMRALMQFMRSRNKKNLTDLFKDNTMALAKEFVSSKQLEKHLEKGVQTFKKEWSQIVSKIKEINPRAKIYVNNLYNPVVFPLHYSLVDKVWYRTLLNSFCEGWIEKINKIIAESAKDYVMVDVFNEFKKSNGYFVGPDYIGLNFPIKSYDPHPTEKGHKIIAQAIIKQMEANGDFEKIQEPSSLRVGFMGSIL